MFRRHLYFIQGSAATYVFSLAVHQTYKRETTSQTRLRSAYIVVLETNLVAYTTDSPGICAKRKKSGVSIWPPLAVLRPRLQRS